MSIPIKSSSPNLLYCELCDYVQFSTYTEFHTHHLFHIRQPLVRLVKLNETLCKKLKGRSYKVNKGVARRSLQLNHVPPLKISLGKQLRVKQFHVTTKKENSSRSNSPTTEDVFGFSDSDLKNIALEETKPRAQSAGNSGVSDVEGKNLLERLGAKITISRKGQPTNEAPPGNGKKDSEASIASPDVKKENLLERLSGIGGISISTKSKSSANGNSDAKPSSGVSISSNAKSIDIGQLKKLTDQEADNEKRAFDKNKILEKLSGSGLICIAPKSQVKTEADKEESSVPASKTGEQGSPKPEASPLEGSDSGAVVANSSRSKSEGSNDSSDSKSSTDSQVNASEEGNGKAVSENSSEGSEPKKFVRVKNSTFSKKNILEKQKSQEENSEERTGNPEEPKEKERRERGVDILERLTDNLSNSVGSEKSGTSLGSAAAAEERRNSNSESMEGPIMTGDSRGEEFRSELSASQPVSSDFQVGGEENPQEQEQECALLLTPPSSSGQEGESSDYSTISSHQAEPFGEPSGASEENNELTENAVSFSSLTSEDQSQEHGEQQSSFWTDLQNSSNNVDQPQQDPLMTPENPVPNGDGMSQNFLHNFLSEPQPPPNSMPPENSEFMSLDRLGQTQHQQPPYDLNSGDPNTPMEQLSQQVQRIPNPTPQINVISQHHMQAPQPPHLHTGVPLSPQHISPQQPNSYDALSHMQQPMPPPLYQGFNMFNQSYPPQTPQQMPRPPMLQQRPHIQPRPFQSLAAPPRQRSRGMKRNSIRLPAPDMAPPKVRRVDHPLQARPQMQNPTAKLPSGITVTPPKKTLEANKVANVLASRGITVTPAASRQTNSSARPQQRQSTPTQPPTLNISSAISITSSSQSRGNGGFAVPGPRRNAPIVNHHVERPERCTTVDLTLDDDLPQVSRNRGSLVLGRYPCNQCGKVFSSSVTLESHKASHRAAAALPFKCDKCTAQYTTATHLHQHKLASHKMKQSAPDLAIPIVDLNHPGARDQLVKCGVYNFIPLAQLQSNNNGYFGVPIIQLDTAKEKAVSNLSLLGAGNILVLGKMKALAPQPNH